MVCMFLQVAESNITAYCWWYNTARALVLSSAGRHAYAGRVADTLQVLRGRPPRARQDAAFEDKEAQNSSSHTKISNTKQQHVCCLHECIQAKRMTARLWHRP